MNGHEYVSNVVSGKDMISLPAMILRNVHKGRLVELQVASDIPPADFVNYANWGFKKWGLKGKLLKPKDIKVDDSEIEDRDVHFAQDFGYIIRRLAFAKLSDGGVEAWIGPTLIHKDHPLAGAMDHNIASFGVSQNPPASEGFEIISTSDIISAHYLRVTVEDKAMVLAQVCLELASEGINICELRQPGNFREEIDPITGTMRKVGVIGEPVDIALLLDPSKRVQVETAVGSIRQLPVVRSVNALFRVIGNPTQDLSNKN